MSAIADAYSRTGAAWQAGPGRIYDALADATLDHCDLALAGRRVLDLGAGTGAASRAAARRGGEVVALDAAFGMLAAGALARPPAVMGDALAIPFPNGSFDAVVAAFSLNHLVEPAAALREAARVLVPGGPLVVTAYAADDAHPVRHAVEHAAMDRGWRAEEWYREVREAAVPRLATVDRARKAACDAGLTGVRVDHVEVAFPDITAEELVAWRLGMAQLAPFVSMLTPAERAALAADALAALGDPPPLVRRMIVLECTNS